MTKKKKETKDYNTKAETFGTDLKTFLVHTVKVPIWFLFFMYFLGACTIIIGVLL